MTAPPIEVRGTVAELVLDAATSGVGGKVVEGRSLGQIAWMRPRRARRDVLSLVVNGARSSMLVAFLATLLAVAARASPTTGG